MNTGWVDCLAKRSGRPPVFIRGHPCSSRSSLTVC